MPHKKKLNPKMKRRVFMALRKIHAELLAVKDSYPWDEMDNLDIAFVVLEKAWKWQDDCCAAKFLDTLTDRQCAKLLIEALNK